MRVTRISVEHLFGLPSFSYDIVLKSEPPITLVHGPNGSGKTVIFRMLHGLFNSNYITFLKYPFRVFRVDFNDGENVTVQREFNEKRNDYGYPVIRYSKVSKPFDLKLDPRFARSIFIRQRPRSRELVDWLELDRALHASDITSRQVAELLDLAGDGQEFRFLDSPAWIQSLSKRLNVSLIDTNRLIISKPREIEDRPRRDIVTVAAIDENSEDLARRIQAVILRADTRAKTLDRSFPTRVVGKVLGGKRTMTYEKIRNRLDELEKRRNRLVEVGLLEPGEQQTNFQIPEQNPKAIEKTLRNVLEVYIKDTEDKLAVYEDLADRIEVFKDIVQEVLRYKRVSINSKGMQVLSDTGLEIPLRELSSGEQHLIVQMYNLLFRTSSAEDELILIDEPEISLHIAWQKQFVTNLERISELSKFDVMIATHSPSIINGRLDLMVGIQGIVE